MHSFTRQMGSASTAFRNVPLRFVYLSTVVRSLAVVIGIMILVASATAQFPQQRRYEQRVQQDEKASEQRDAKREAELNAGNILPTPKKGVMNVDVRAVLTTTDVTSFAEATTKPATSLKDGDPLWAWLKFNGKLGDYVLTVFADGGPPEREYLLLAEIAPVGDATVLSKYVLRFAKEELEKTEVKVNLSPGMQLGQSTTPVFIDFAATQPAGRWNAELRVANSDARPRALTDNLATAPFRFEVAAGPRAYASVRDDFDNVYLRGSADAATLPPAGMFYSLPVKTAIYDALAKKNIKPERFYFASNGWLESRESMLEPVRKRRVYAAFTYREGETCKHSTAEFVERFDAVSDKFVPDTVEFGDVFPLACTELK